MDPSAKCLSRLYLETFNRNIIVGRFPWQFRWAILLCFTSKPIQNNDLDQISLPCPLWCAAPGQTKASEICSKEVQKMQLCGLLSKIPFVYFIFSHKESPGYERVGSLDPSSLARSPPRTGVFTSGHRQVLVARVDIYLAV